MAYINFKEERFKCKGQLEKRRENNKKLFQTFTDDESILKEYSPWNSYKTEENQYFGHDGIEDEKDYYELCNKDIVCVRFYRCKFNNIKFTKCNFIGCIFEECEFSHGGVIFENCTFLKESHQDIPSLNKYDNFSCEFINCNLYVKFLNSNLAFCIFDNCNVENTNFEQTDLSNVIIDESFFKMIIIIDSNLTGAKFLATYIEDLEFRDLGTSKLDEKSFFDKIPIREKTKEEYEGLYMVYETIADKFKENNLTNNFGEYYYLCNVVKRKVLKPIPKFTSWLYFASCGYGERPEYALIFSSCIILIFAVVFLFTGIEIDNTLIQYSTTGLSGISFIEILKQFNSSVNASIAMFTGVGNEFIQSNQINLILESLEMILGVVMMGVGIGALTRKIVR